MAEERPPRQGGYLIEGTSPPVLLISPPHVGAMPELHSRHAVEGRRYKTIR
jgi:hypothetical protein